MRLDKFLALNDFGSRKDTKKLIKDKFVTINDKIVRDPKVHVDLNHDQVKVKNVLVEYKEKVYFMLNKPADYICSHEEGKHPSVLELLDLFRSDLIIVGRLDVDTEGLLLITNDGQFSHQVAHGKKNVYKKYYVELEKDFNTDFIPSLEAGIEMDDVMLKPAKVEVLGPKSLYLSISEGRYHQVKRMMHYADNEVSYLKRIEIGKLILDKNLELGSYRELTKDEVIFYKIAKEGS